MLNNDPVHPRWVLVNGELHNVSEFSEIEPKKRPLALCPLCQTSVILKLGTLRAHHYAHQSEVDCVATQPETALHLNAKYYLYSQLQQCRSIHIEINCIENCGIQRQILWLQEWDDIVVERYVNGYRPDITLFSKGSPVGALEVFVSHSVGETKASWFLENQIRGLEISVNSEEFYEGENRWTSEKPLPFSRAFPAFRDWICEACLKRKQQQELREKQEQARRAYREKNFKRPLCSSMVDIYFPSGKKYREMFFLMEQYKDGKRARVWIKTEKDKTVASTSTLIDQPLESLQPSMERYLDRYRKMGAIIDTIVEWQPWTTGKKYVSRDTTRYPFRYYWEEKQKHWLPITRKHFASKRVGIRETKNAYHREKITSPIPDSRTGTCKYCGKVTEDWVEWNKETKQGTCRDCRDKLPPVSIRQPKTGTCKYCGEVTDDWVSYNGKTKECTCRKCKDKVNYPHY